MLNKEYLNHKVFDSLDHYSNFYKSLSFSIMHFISSGTQSVINIDSYLYSSIHGTLESIKDILFKGRINDSFALLRKYYDSTIINIYSILFLRNNFEIENLVVKQIDNWLKGKDRLPEFRIMSNYIRESEKLKRINELLYQDKTYNIIRDRCNDHTHYNFYHNVLLNDNEIHLPNRISTLDYFLDDLTNILIMHLSYLFTLNDFYMMSTDLIDTLDMGITPEDGLQYNVEPFVQNIFDTVIKVKRNDLANEIKNNTPMQLG